MKAQKEYLKIKDLYTAINKKVLIGFFIITISLFVIGTFVQFVLYIATFVLLFGGYICFIFIHLNRRQIQVSFKEYYDEFLDSVLLKTNVRIPQIFDRQQSDMELKQLFGDLLDLQLNVFMEGIFEYEDVQNVVSKVNVRKYENHVSSTYFNGMVLKFKLTTETGDFLYTEKTKSSNYSEKYALYEQVNLINDNSLYVLDENDYQNAVSYVNKLEQHLGDDITILKKKDFVYVATTYKINLEAITRVTYQFFNESDFGAVVDEYISLHNLCVDL